QPDVPALLVDVTRLAEAGRTTDAADALANLLEMQPPLPVEDQIELHDRLAELLFEQEQRRPVALAANLERLLEHVEAAERLGAPRTARRILRSAQVQEWLGRPEDAIRSCREALQTDPSPEEGRAAMRSLVRLLDGRPEAAAQREELLETLLSDESLDDDSAWWAMRQAVDAALEKDDPLQARLLLSKYAARLSTSDLKGYFEYLWACVLMHEGRFEEAAPLVYWVDEWIKRIGQEVFNSERLRELTGLNRWLLGRVYLAQEQPDEALAAFEEAAAFKPDDPAAAGAATVGQAEALAGLGRHEDSRAALRAAAQMLPTSPGERDRALKRVRATVRELWEARLEAADYANAQDYLSLAAELTPPDLPAEKLEILEKLGGTALLAANAA
ncbi:MAG TPA: hypothetical protein PLU99_14540, partial [Phycisphaerae bacterium]|nr:hypothetical protein [Phycisphaerae bacterium]